MKTFAFLGDSVTEGCFALYPTSYGFDTVREPGRAYPALLRPLLEERLGAVRLINAGRSGSNAHQALEGLDGVLAQEPDVAVVCFGLNDVFHPLARYDEALRALVTRLRSRCRVVLVTPNMLNTYIHPDTLPCARKVACKTQEFQTSGVFDRYMDAARRAAAELDAALLDWYAVWQARFAAGHDTTRDLCNYINHPAPALHAELARLLLPLLVKEARS